MRVRVAWAANLAVLLATACQGPSHPVTPGAGDAAAQRILLFPIDVVLAATELGTAEQRVERELAQYLADQGRRLETLDRSVAEHAWRAALRDTGWVSQRPVLDAPEFDAAVARLARDLAAERSFDVLLLPAIVSRPATRKGLRVRWDGVTRRIEVPPGPFDAPGIRVTRGEPTVRASQLKAPSLWCVVVGRDGARVFQGFGGLDLPFAGKWVPRGDTPPLGPADLRLELAPLAEPFQDPDALREGVGRALDPYLPYRPARPVPPRA